MSVDSITCPLGLASQEIAPAHKGRAKIRRREQAVTGETMRRHRRDVTLSGQDQAFLARARHLIREGGSRQTYFPGIDFCDPAWAILLDLFVAQLMRKPVSISSACIASGVPQTTALRCIDRLVRDKALYRVADRADARRVYLMLSKDALASMRSYLSLEMFHRERRQSDRAPL